MTFHNSVTPNIKSCHVVELLLQRRQLFLVFFCVEVAGLNWCLEEVLAVWSIICVQKQSVKVLVQLTCLVFHQKLYSVHELGVLTTLLSLPFHRTIQILTAECFFGFWIHRLHDFSGILWVNPQRVKPNAEGVLLAHFEGYLIIIQK